MKLREAIKEIRQRLQNDNDKHPDETLEIILQFAEEELNRRQTQMKSKKRIANCPLCETPCEIVGRVTLHYEPIKKIYTLSQIKALLPSEEELESEIDFWLQHLVSKVTDPKDYITRKGRIEGHRQSIAQEVLSCVYKALGLEE